MTPSSQHPPSSPPHDDRGFSDVAGIMAALRGPDGCPWDREQTTESLKPYLLEEVYEVLEAIDAKDPIAIKEELGDLLLQILFHSQIASEKGHFSYQDVQKELGEKLVRRHPHVFQRQNNHSPLSSGDVLRQWEELKQQEKGYQPAPSSVMSSVPKTSPALQRALQVQKRASRVGFDWNTIEPVLKKFREELDELYDATRDTSHVNGEVQNLPTTPPEHSDIENEFGDVLFSLVNISRFLRINPEEALRKSTNKFIRRFQYVETQATTQGKQVKDFPLETLDQWWEAAKQQEVALPPMLDSNHTTRP